MKILKRKLGLLALPLLALTSSSYAEITFNGFATIAGGQTTSSDKTLIGYDDQLGFKADSLVALQASADLGDGLGVTTQIISRGSDDWSSSFEWAYISYDVNDEWRLLFGRQRAPQKLYSDFVDVGYAYPWITPPSGLYSPSFDSYDGVGSIYNFTIGSFDSTFHTMLGRSSDNPFGDTVDSIDISKFMIGALTLSDGFITARVAAASRQVDVVIPGVDDSLVGAWKALANHPQLSQTGIDFVQIGEDIAINDTASFITAAVKADFDGGFAVIEWEQNDYGDNFLGQTNNWYASGGINFEGGVVFATYGSNETEISSLTSPDRAAGLGLDALIIGSKAAMGGQLKDESYMSLGARWDFHDSAAVKVEFTKFDDSQVNPYNPADLESDASVMRVALVTVF